jgi:PAS domain S-box-containing protein
MRNIPDHVYFKDTESRFVRCSTTLVGGLGLTDLAQVIGKTDADFFTADHAQSARADELNIMRTGKPIIGIVEKEIWIDGHTTWALTTKMPWYDKAGRIIGTFGVSKDITELKRAQAQVEETHEQLMTASRQAGMAEVATSVLHNVGNVLTSVNVSTTLLTDLTKNSRISMIGKVAALVTEHANDPGFLTAHPKGQQIPGYLSQLSEHLLHDQQLLLTELETLAKNVDHIKEIVVMQQNYGKVSGLVDSVPPHQLVEDALRFNAEALARDDIHIVRDYAPVPDIVVDKHKALQILVNLIRNAKWACVESRALDRWVKLSVHSHAPDRIRIQVVDNGVGIALEHLTRVFSHGFTTRKDGHGFGLHTSALASTEMGGSLTGQSDGLGRGAVFTLELPQHPPNA